MESDLLNLGSYLRKLRRERNLTQEQIAERAGLHPTYISRIERGKSLPALGVLNRIAEVLGVSSGTILERLQSPPAGAEPAQGIRESRRPWDIGRMPPSRTSPGSVELERLLQDCTPTQLALVKDFVHMLILGRHCIAPEEHD